MNAHNTAIEWTHIPGFKGETWNPVVGCSVVSPGCTHCYAMTMAHRLSAMGPQADGSGNPHLTHYQGTVTEDPTGRGYAWSRPVWTGKVARASEKTLHAPLRWAKPRAVFVNSMGDLFHEGVPDAWIYECLAVMAMTYDASATDESNVVTARRQRHVYLVLTKRAERMRAFMAALHAASRANPFEFEHPFGAAAQTVAWSRGDRYWMNAPLTAWQWVLDGCPGLWLGVSVEDQARADARIPDLLATPAAVRFVSAEPLLGPVDLTSVWARMPGGGKSLWNSLQRGDDGARLDWVIAGGESGAKARPMHPDWARGVRDQCAAAGTPFFFKQWGEWAPANEGDLPERLTDPACDQFRCVSSCGFVGDLSIGSAFLHKPRTHPSCFPNGENGDAICSSVFVRRVGKKAGHSLDGAVHHAWPEAAR